MKRQLLINGLAGVVLIALVGWIASNTYWEEYDQNTGLQGDALTDAIDDAELEPRRKLEAKAQLYPLRGRFGRNDCHLGQQNL